MFLMIYNKTQQILPKDFLHQILNFLKWEKNIINRFDCIKVKNKKKKKKKKKNYIHFTLFW